MNKLLKKYIDASGYKMKYIANRLDITYVALHNKLTGKTEFTISEAFVLKSLLKIPSEEWEEIFKHEV